MFGKNKPTGLSHFKDTQGKMLVTSVFTTIQGEGPYRGEVCVFVRLAKCQLTCSFCDTYFDSGEWLSPDELCAKIGASMEREGMKYLNTEYIGLVFTGGEPSLQRDTLMPFMNEMRKHFRWVQVETNGIIPFNEPNVMAGVTVVMSPKCLEDKDGRATRYYALRQDSLDTASCLKFVMCDDLSSPYSSIPDWAFEWRADDPYYRQIFVSPMNIYNDVPRAAKQARLEGRELSLEERSVVDEVISFWEPGLLDMEANRRNHLYTARYAMQHNLIFQVQLHLYAGLA